jgi:hypothetical protein
MAEVKTTSSITANMSFDSSHYPGDSSMLGAWHDLEKFILSHPVLSKSKWNTDVYLGDGGE